MRQSKVKKWGAWILSLFMLFSSAACAVEANSGESSSGSFSGSDDTPVKNEVLGEEEHLHYESDKEFLIYPYGGVPGKLRVYDKNGGIIEEAVEISDEQMLEYYKQIKDVGMTMTQRRIYQHDLSGLCSTVEVLRRGRRFDDGI